MIRKLSTWLLVASVGGVLVAGCGSSSSSSSQTSSTPAATTSATTTSPATTTTPTTTPSTTGGSDKGGSSGSQSGAAAVAQCKQGVQAATTLSASVKSKLLAICEKAGSGDPNAVRKAAQEVCAELINASPIPAGPAKEKALASCKK